LTRVAWRVFITARQFIKNPENWVALIVWPGGTVLTVRRFLKGTQKNRKHNMCRLAVVHYPLGSFWKNSQKREIQQKHTFIMQ